MQLDHERLDVYELALEFLVLANGIIEGLPRGRSQLADQFTRASLSIVLTVARPAVNEPYWIPPGAHSPTHGKPNPAATPGTGTGTGTFTGPEFRDTP
jgi:hypothetical protein